MRRIVAVLLLSVPLLFGAFALTQGRDSNWDLRNYHWYNAYAALHGRLDIDMGAAQAPTFYNPTLDIPFYIAADHLPAKVFAFLFGTLQGCNFILLYFIAMRTLTLENPRRQAAASLAIAFVGMIGAGQLSQINAAFYDNILSLFIFTGILAVLRYKDVLLRRAWVPALASAALAGVFVGFAVGLKLTSQIFAVGACFGLLFIPGPYVRRFFLSFACGIGIIAGFLICGGWWMWEMWTHYANPVFPYFNDVIRSPWATAASYRDARYFAKTVADALAMPFRMFVDAKVAGEIVFRDARVLAGYVIIIATAVMLALKRLQKTETKAPPYADAFAMRYLVAMAVLSYVVWLNMFSIYRYMLPLEMLAPLLVVGCLAFWPVGRTRQVSLAIGILGFMVITTQPGDWGRKPWGDAPLGGKLVQVTLPPIADPAHTMVIMMGQTPTSFVIPSFPPEIPFLRPHSFMADPRERTKFTATIQDRIDAHKGDLLLLRTYWDDWPIKLLPIMGLDLVPDSCRPIRDNLDGELELCDLMRVPPVDPAQIHDAPPNS